eukprot:TRINITY_DN5033_c0_g2_i5.p1 TRINITY_DN5033_c0_g2~~TRINITY_DN5033_c0_g2_i5.p1  ORF type:complete len:246 (+),score=0.21 TRINITY_DN5033_c0_g2_i5:208-945(+)
MNIQKKHQTLPIIHYNQKEELHLPSCSRFMQNTELVLSPNRRMVSSRSSNEHHTTRTKNTKTHKPKFNIGRVSTSTTSSLQAKNRNQQTKHSRKLKQTGSRSLPSIQKSSQHKVYMNMFRAFLARLRLGFCSDENSKSGSKKYNKENVKSECGICFEFSQSLRQCVKCRNSFCKACIERWREVKDQCPLRCRGSFQVRELVYFKCRNHRALRMRLHEGVLRHGFVPNLRDPQRSRDAPPIQVQGR